MIFRQGRTEVRRTRIADRYRQFDTVNRLLPWHSDVLRLGTASVYDDFFYDFEDMINRPTPIYNEIQYKP